MSKNNHNFFKRCLYGAGNISKKAFLRMFLSKKAIKAIENKIITRSDFAVSLKDSYKFNLDVSPLAKKEVDTKALPAELVRKKEMKQRVKPVVIPKQPEITITREGLLNNLHSIYRQKQDIFSNISEDDKEKIQNIAKSIFK